MMTITKKDNIYSLENSKNQPRLFNGLVEFQNKNLVCIASDPEQGKTSLALQMALEYTQKSDMKVYIFSFELFSKDIYERMACYLANIDLCHINNKTFSDDELKSIAIATQKLKSLNIIVDDDSHLSVNDIIERVKNTENCGLVVIDYLQLIRSESNLEWKCAMGEIGHELKILATTMNIPVIVTSQWRTRGKYSSALARLGDTTGDLVDDADTILSIQHNDDTKETEICIEKNKHLVFGSVKYTEDERFIHLDNPT